MLPYPQRSVIEEKVEQPDRGIGQDCRSNTKDREACRLRFCVICWQAIPLKNKKRKKYKTTQKSRNLGIFIIIFY